MEIKASETNSEFATGAVRGDSKGRGTPHLLPFEALVLVSRCYGGPAFMPFDGVIEVSKIYEGGCATYPPRNWEKGIPLARFVDSSQRHLGKYLRGEIDEPHCGQHAWNLLSLLQTHLWIAAGRLPPELCELPGIDLTTDLHSVQPFEVLPGRPLSHYANESFGMLAAYVTGKGGHCLVTAVANSLSLLHVHTELCENRAPMELNDLPRVKIVG